MEEGEAAGTSKVHFLFITSTGFVHGENEACGRGKMLNIQWADGGNGATLASLPGCWVLIPGWQH